MAIIKGLIKSTKTKILAFTGDIFNEGESDERRGLHVVILDNAGEDVNPAKEKTCTEGLTETDIAADKITFTSTVTAFALENRGNNPITFTINTIPFIVDPGVCTDIISFTGFTEVGITGTSPEFQAWGFV